jgi:hypothetical protein
MPIPDKDRIIDLMDKAMAIEDRLPPTQNQHDSKHEDNLTEPVKVILFIIFSNYLQFT